MDKRLPVIRTERLALRPFTADDVARVTELAGDRRISDTTLLIPHPYEPSMAEEWINTHGESFAAGKGVTLAVARADTGELVGAVGISVEEDHNRGELGYWIGVPYWGNGYCTEAARAVVEYGFNELKLHKIFANHCRENTASGRVMRKIGMEHEGSQAEHVRKNGVYYSIELYGIVNPSNKPD